MATGPQEAHRDASFRPPVLTTSFNLAGLAPSVASPARSTWKKSSHQMTMRASERHSVWRPSKQRASAQCHVTNTALSRTDKSRKIVVYVNLSTGPGVVTHRCEKALLRRRKHTNGNFSITITMEVGEKDGATRFERLSLTLESTTFTPSFGSWCALTSLETHYCQLDGEVVVVGSMIPPT